MPSSSLSIQLPAVNGYEKIAMRFAAHCAEHAGFAKKQCEDIRTIVSEACINAFEHCLAEKDSVDVTCSCTVDKAVLTISDYGTSSLNIEAVSDTMHLNERVKNRKNSDSIRGWGLYLIKRLSSSVASSVDNGRQKLTIVVDRMREE